jgi:hypothetical protein
MSKLIRYRLRLKETVPCNIRVFEKLAVVMRPQGWIYTRAWRKQRFNSCRTADLTVKGAAFVFRALADGWVRGVGCYDEGLDDDDDDDKSPGFGAGLTAIITAGV